MGRGKVIGISTLPRTAFRVLERRFAQAGRRGFVRFSRIVAFGSVFVGSMALTLALAILEGFQRTLYEQALRFTWHFQVRTFGGRPFAYSAVVERLRQGFPEAIVAAVREREALIRTVQGGEGILLRALNLPLRAVPLRLHIVEGQSDFSADTAAELFVGQALARKLGIGVSDTVLVITAVEQRGGAVPVLRRFRVAGVYRSGLARYEELYV
ncbi:MAG: hypothetical protein NZ949_04515, partial [Candidatus Kapabacteria bacterium]|nr:hypothetical protein [Candidatus Kapabacteria bacterium]MDW7997582.1 hypothetical protein [Bacteroidota bacterium]